MDINDTAPCCDNDVTITNRDILRGILHQKETLGKVMVGCPDCHTVLVMDPTMPTDTPLFEKWVVQNKERADWNPCVPFLDERIEAEPAGSVEIAHKTMYRAGSGGKLLTRYEYMVLTGQDPERAIKDNTSLGAKPFVVGAAR